MRFVLGGRWSSAARTLTSLMRVQATDSGCGAMSTLGGKAERTRTNEWFLSYRSLLLV